MGTLYLFKQVFGWSAVAAVVVNQIMVYNFVFFLNKYWVFSAKGMLIGQMLRYCALAAANYAIALFFMWFFHVVLGQNYLMVRLANIALATAWNFFLYRYFVYRPKPLTERL